MNFSTVGLRKTVAVVALLVGGIVRCTLMYGFTKRFAFDYTSAHLLWQMMFNCAVLLPWRTKANGKGNSSVLSHFHLASLFSCTWILEWAHKIGWDVPFYTIIYGAVPVAFFLCTRDIGFKKLAAVITICVTAVTARAAELDERYLPRVTMGILYSLLSAATYTLFLSVCHAKINEKQTGNELNVVKTFFNVSALALGCIVVTDILASESELYLAFIYIKKGYVDKVFLLGQIVILIFEFMYEFAIFYIMIKMDVLDAALAIAIQPAINAVLAWWANLAIFTISQNWISVAALIIATAYYAKLRNERKEIKGPLMNGHAMKNC